MDKKAFKTATLEVGTMLVGAVILCAFCWLADSLIQSGRVAAGCLLVFVTFLALFWLIIYYCEKE